MDDHICFKCAECSIRKVGTFYETNCKFFPAVKQQVDGNVTECEHLRIKKSTKLNGGIE